MPVIDFTIPGVPVSKGRARAFVTKSGKPGHYTPKKTVTHEGIIRTFACQAMRGRPPVQGTVRLSVHFYLPIPKSWTKGRKEDARLGQLVHTIKPDLDNLVKAVKDGCNGVLWADDCQIWFLTASKGYSDTPITRVMVDFSL